MERTAQQQACELAQLHRTIANMASMLVVQKVLQERQWRGMRTWLEERGKKWYEHHTDYVLWGKGIMDTVTRVMPGTEQA